MEIFRLDFTSREFKENPLPVLAELIEAGPVVRAKIPIIGKVWLVTTYDAVCDFLRNDKLFVREGKNAGKHGFTDIEWWLSRIFRAPADNMLAKDEPDHRRLRNLVEKAFQRRSVEEMRSRIETITDELLDQTAAESNADGIVDFQDFAQQLPLAVICELLGLPDEDRPKFTRWAAGTTTVGSLAALLRLLPNMFKIRNYLRRQFKICQQSPREGLLSLLVETELAGDSLSESELTSMAFLLLFAGHVTTVHLLGVGLLSLLDHPDQKQGLMEDWSKIESAVEEMLRHGSPVPFSKPRRSSKETEFHGQELKQGQFVLGMLASANFDPARFENPERFAINRHPNPHLSFGTGIHVCLGLKLARLEAQVAFERLFTRFPELELAIPRDQIPWGEGGMRAFKSLPVKLNP